MKGLKLKLCSTFSTSIYCQPRRRKLKSVTLQPKLGKQMSLTCECGVRDSTRVKLLGEAAHLLTVVRGHSCTTSLVFSSTLITDSLVIPNSRGTSLFLPFIFSCLSRKKISHNIYLVCELNTYTDDSLKVVDAKLILSVISMLFAV